MALVFDYVICKATGEPIDDVRNSLERHWSQQRNTIGTATIKILLTDPLAAYLDPNIGTRLKVYRRATAAEILANPNITKQILVFYGSLPPTTVTQDAAEGTVTAVFQDQRWLLAYRYLQTTLQYVNQSYGFILNDVLTRINAASDTYMSLSTSGTERINRNYDIGKNVLEIWNELTGLNDALDFFYIPLDFWATSGLPLMCNSFFGSISPADSGSVFTYANPLLAGTLGGLPSNCLNITRSWAPPINFARTSSTDATGMANYGTYGPVASAIGRIEAFESYSDAVNAATLTARAQSLVLQNQIPKSLLTIQPAPNSPQVHADYQLGQTILVNCRMGSMTFTNQTCRVEGWNISISENGEITETGLTVTPQ